MKEGKLDWGFFAVRIILGAMFFLAGLGKFLMVQKVGNAGIATMIGNIGFPVPGIFAWILIFSELIFGLLLIIGWKTKYIVWPLIIILAVATLGVLIPGAVKSGGDIFRILSSNLFFHILGIAVLVLLFLRGPGKIALDKKE
ncbi:MAG: DoxX family protein [Nanoarchaeota archaeon]|nr:DoxX family protein [Nanoarchaeota archaeon]